MWRKIFKIFFYVLFVILLLSVIIAGGTCIAVGIMDANRFPHAIPYGIGVLVGGILLVLSGFAFFGMMLEAAENIAKIKEDLENRKCGRHGGEGCGCHHHMNAEHPGMDGAVTENPAAGEYAMPSEPIGRPAEGYKPKMVTVPIDSLSEPQMVGVPDAEFPKSSSWTCRCGRENKAESHFCVQCGSPRPEA